LSAVLFGSTKLMALGEIMVEVSMKKISNKNTKSDMDVALNVASIRFCILIAMAAGIRRFREADP
jgi:hypothetical protein